ncbi:hypothetical protein BUALT_Bualt02G0160200 [Buddleja alternifolia]|uniref:Cytochrome P450 n=1 Tax=Buddleja alternifolia TaxID=168488 RepID=A0AAV6Y7Q7_9LAMI|nr:hypothetical protein BUALT_Bualt02G0160200 [Buddleja alternifolia]
MSSDYTFLFIPSTHDDHLLNFELFLCFLLFISVFVFWLTPGGLAWALSMAHTRPKPAIPGPSGLPLIGSLLCFTNSLTHRLLSKLSQSFKAGQLMAFSVGFTRFVISSNPDTAKEILNSSAFADRPVKESAYELLFHRAMGFAPYGEYWRNLRRISATHLFSPKRIAFFGEMRKEIGLKMVKEIMEKNCEEVQVKNVLHFGSLNNVMMSVFGKRYDFNGDDAVEVEALVKEGYELLGTFNWSDHFPILGWLDLQRVRKRSKVLVEKVNVFVGKIIEEHKLKRADQIQVSNDFVDVLLDLEKENDNGLSHSDMIAVLWI